MSKTSVLFDEVVKQRDHLLLQAQCHAQEMRTHKATVNEIYQVLTGATGEPGNWNGAEPARKVMEKLEKRDELVRELVEALELVLGVISYERGWGTVSRMEGSWIYTEASQAKAVAIPILAKAKAIDAEETR